MDLEWILSCCSIVKEAISFAKSFALLPFHPVSEVKQMSQLLQVDTQCIALKGKLFSALLTGVL